MGSLVKPKVFLVGFTTADVAGITEYLEYTKQTDFLETWKQAMSEGISSGEALCSLFAKLCYKSLVLGKNSNVTRVRDVQNNLIGCHDTGHSSVFEHCQLNFLVTDCSRVYTHEQVRHRVGFAYSQTSGRYCRLDNIDLVWSDLLDPVKDLFLEHLKQTEDVIYLAECRLGLRKPPEAYPDITADFCFCKHPDVREPYRWVPDNSFNFDKRKAITSAIRRIAPNGQANEIGMSCNIRALRHAVQLRTQRFAETEIRDIWGQVYCLVKARFPTIFYGAREHIHDNLLEISGMKMQPYEIEAGNPASLRFYTKEQLWAEVAGRDAAK